MFGGVEKGMISSTVNIDIEDPNALYAWFRSQAEKYSSFNCYLLKPDQLHMLLKNRVLKNSEYMNVNIDSIAMEFLSVKLLEGWKLAFISEPDDRRNVVCHVCEVENI